MENELYKFLFEFDFTSEYDVISNAEYVIQEFVNEYSEYDINKVRNFYYNTIIRKCKQNIINDKLEQINEDFLNRR